MKLGPADFAILAGYFALTLGMGLYFARRAQKTMLDYFLSHRSLPWWMAGTAMVATTFSADTPLAVTEMVAKQGVAGNWLWWSMLPSGMLTVFLFARLWRRSEMVTDVELAELRYSGNPAAFLRGFRAAYLGLVVNIIIMGWVNLGMAKVLEGTLGVDKWQAIILCLLVTFAYTVISGFWGVAATDALQYLFEMGGAILLAVIAVNAVGGMDGMKAGLAAAHPAGSAAGTVFGSADAAISFLPADATWAVPMILFAALLTLNWWASWYPGAEPGGGGYVVQNMLACKDERHSRNAALFFNIAHYAIRSWPWVITALCSLALYGGAVKNAAGVEDPGGNYVRIMVELLPAGMRGLMLASFAAAYMSTMATQMNWGSSYLTNDLYRRFINRNATEKHYVMASRLSVGLTVTLSLIATANMDQVSKAWELLLMLGAGTGLVYILRWYWWRINAWSEVSAMASAFVVSITLRALGPRVPAFDTGSARGFATVLITTTVITTLVWLATTLLTSPEKETVLRKFYLRVRPAGPGWAPLARATGVHGAKGEIARNLYFWVLGVIFVYSIMFTTGALLFDQRRDLLIFGTALLVSGGLLFYGLSREPAPEEGIEEAA
jgi:SSS family solute:Na+ symporter